MHAIIRKAAGLRKGQEIQAPGSMFNRFCIPGERGVPMKSAMIAVLAAVTALCFYPGAARAQDVSQPPPPIEQPLVSEGEFAIKLSAALNLGFTQDEVEAEDSLAKIDISPRNGWISDYPITPDIIEEIRQSAVSSSSSGKLLMGQADAAKAVSDVCARFNLALSEDGAPGESADNNGSNPYASTTNLDSYYNEYGPPVVTYYVPPEEYGYLYAWVPCPFLWGRNYFNGYYILNDFDTREGYYTHRGNDNHFYRPYRRHWRGHRITNHATGANGAVTRINPLARADSGGGTSKTSTTSLPSNGSTFHSARDQAGARTIIDHAEATSPAGMAGGAYPAGRHTEAHGHAGIQPGAAYRGQTRGSGIPSRGSSGDRSATSSDSSSTGISSGGLGGGFIGEHR